MTEPQFRKAPKMDLETAVELIGRLKEEAVFRGLTRLPRTYRPPQSRPAATPPFEARPRLL